MLIGNWLLRSGRGVESLFLFLWDFSLFGRSSRSLSRSLTHTRARAPLRTSSGGCSVSGEASTTASSALGIEICK